MTRMARLFLSTLALSLAGLALTSTARGQMIPAKPPRMPPPASQLLYVKLRGPEGAKATFYPAPYRAQALDMPAQVGLRPGYTYRFKISGISERENEALYPTMEVIGTLHMPKPLKAAKHPVPIVFRQEEVYRALQGSYFTKVFIIESPDRAVPVTSVENEPLESEIGPQFDILSEARSQGRPLLILRFGYRQRTDQELYQCAVDGTVLLPNDKYLGPPAKPPYLPWACIPIHDPKLGPRIPDEECMHDGGDTSPPAGQDGEGNLYGLDPTDSVAQYIDGKGVKRIAVSNRVCLCVPRFVVLRNEIAPLVYDTAQGPLLVRQTDHDLLVRLRHPTIPIHQYQQTELLRNLRRPSITQESQGPITIDRLVGTGLVIGDVGGKVVIGVCKKEPKRKVRPLVLCKWHDKPEAQIGDVVTFFLKYTNPGEQPIRDVVVSDSLTARLEYVPGSNRTDRNAVFTTRENEAGSLILRWQINGPLLAGQSGTVSFQARIR